MKFQFDKLGALDKCELKSEKPNEAEYMLQFRNSGVFVKFLSAIVEEFYQFNLRKNVSVKYIIFDKQQSNRYNKTAPFKSS